ncbi:DUF305 domain-containing protein [Arsenicicoccus piscis]|uniref:DUF305 domain-containing protein n=1 Tax=Arsenicicoccus piscis TaxID=673954 RepID=A0ABQ6HUX6_9MICO|nr:DUF305 domain-containing protein [Arsenicicoccus piscis]MCH8627489.1 DUF305 domain-containing protein [Arsenicicoccus piscis]GMA21663.1 hypothetical protein GCM10025862_36840 [Arsenicicoccus piscis]
MRQPVRRTLAVVAAALTAATLAACSSTSNDSGMTGMDHSASPMPSGSSPTVAGSSDARTGDVMFAQMMIPHHQQAIEMADLALKNSTTSAEVRTLATDIKNAQDPEIATMRGWLSSWGTAPSASGHMDHGTGMMSDADMNKLETAQGAEFDRMWLTMMVEHHRGAVTMAQQVLTTTKDPEVKQLAEAIIKAQNAEITTMQGLL